MQPLRVEETGSTISRRSEPGARALSDISAERARGIAPSGYIATEQSRNRCPNRLGVRQSPSDDVFFR